MNRTQFLFLLLFIYFFALSPVVSQTLSPISVENLKEDFTEFRIALEKAHPKPYQFVSKSRLDSIFDKTYNSISRPMTEWEFRKLLSIPISEIRCSHTFINVSESYSRYFQDSVRLFPYRLRIFDGHFYIIRNLNPGDVITAGAELLSINDIPISTLRDSIYKYMKNNAFTSTFREERFEYSFYLFYSWYIGNPAEFKVTYIDPRTFKEEILIAHGITQRELMKMPRPDLLGYSNNARPLRLSFIRDSIAVMTIETFSPEFAKSFGQDIDFFYSLCIDSINKKKIKHLVIDLRTNPGGETTASRKLYEYIAERDFEWYKNWEIPSMDPFKDFNSHTLYPRRPVFVRSLYEKNKSGTYFLKFGVELGIHKPSRNEYKGKVYFLTNGNSKSAAGMFCSVAHYNKRGIFIGRETGENYEGFSAGDGTTLTLINSKLKLFIPEGNIHIAVQSPFPMGRGVLPDYQIKETLESVLKNQDLYLEKVLELINKK